MRKILFVNAPSCFTAYSGTKTNAVLQRYPLLGHAILAAVARQLGNKVDVLDLGIIENWQEALVSELQQYKPNIICMSSMTPLFNEVAEVSFFIRKHVGKDVTMILGGPHPTALPEESLRESAFDIVVISEGEKAFEAILNGTPLKKIPGVYYKDGENICSTPGHSYVEDLDTIPYPAYDLYDLSKYKMPKIVAKKSPMAVYMASRGCAFNCSFCDKNIFGRKMRYKSPGIVVDQIKYLLKLGFKEVRFNDDLFTTNIERAKTICERIIHSNLKFQWQLSSGVRVDRVDLEFLKLAKRAGCYSMGVGFEAADQKALDSANKKIKVAQSYKAEELFKKAKMDYVGFFMLGLPSDTEETLKKTIKFATELDCTFAKVTVTVPFPGTSLFREYEAKGLIKSRDWSKYNFHSIKEIYQHPNLNMETLSKYYNKFYHVYYLRPSYIIKTFFRAIREGTIFHYILYAAQTLFPKFLKTNPKYKYKKLKKSL